MCRPEPEQEEVNQQVLEFSPDSPHLPEWRWGWHSLGLTQGWRFPACGSRRVLSQSRGHYGGSGLTCSPARTPGWWRWWRRRRCPGCSWPSCWSDWPGCPGCHRSQWRLCLENCLDCGTGGLPSPWLGPREKFYFLSGKETEIQEKMFVINPAISASLLSLTQLISRTVSTEMS